MNRMFPDTSMPDQSSTYIELQTVQPGPHYYYYLHQETAPHTSAYNTQYGGSSFQLGGHQVMEAWNLGQHQHQPTGGHYTPSFGWPTAPSYTHFHYGHPADVMFPGVLEDSSFTPPSPTSPPSLSRPPSPPSPPASPAPPSVVRHQDNISRKRKRSESPKKVYIKKPLNAFMLFMKERRPTVRPEIKCQGSGVVNAHLGSVWKSLTKEEQEKYYEEAEDQKFLHQQQHPGWSTRENYGKRRTKAEKRRLEQLHEESTSESDSEGQIPESEDEEPPSKWMLMTATYRDKMRKTPDRRKKRLETRVHRSLRARKRTNYCES